MLIIAVKIIIISFVCLQLKQFILKYFYYILSIISLLIINSCANMDLPSGGPKDSTPPKIKESNPPNYSTNFKDDKILILFDEFITLNNINQKLLISPPLENKPKIINKGKFLIININNELLDNTTYTFNFNDAIADIHENNAEKNFQFVFSTGNHLDSLKINGYILDAYSHEKQKDVLVCLYNENIDSLPMLETPYYISKTNENGFFSLGNLKEGSYKIFAIKDLNSNFLFDLPNEPVAFLDTMITPYAEVRIDTFFFNKTSDTLNSDSIKIDTIINFYPEELTLYLFEHDYKKQYITNKYRPSQYQVFTTFNRPLFDSTLTIIPQSIDLAFDSIGFIEYNPTFDTINIWLTDSNIYNRDTLNFVFKYLIKDSMNNFIENHDTATLVYRQQKSTKKEEQQEFKKILKYISNVVDGNIMELNKTISIQFDTPIKEISKDSVSIFEIMEDSSETSLDFSIIKDTLKQSKIKILFEIKPQKRYRLLLLPGSVTDYYGLSNDSITINFSTRELEYYGTVNLNIPDSNTTYIVYLTNESNKILRTYYVDKENKTIKIDYLLPGKYKFFAIEDKNHNRKWDTGNYYNKVFPEKVIYYNETIEVKSNWEMNISWEME